MPTHLQEFYLASAWRGVCVWCCLDSFRGCDLVLGIQWLTTLYTIKWNFLNLKMEFYLRGRHYVLRGLKASEVHMISEEQLPKALLNATHLCMIQVVPNMVTSSFSLETAQANTPQSLALQSLIQQHQVIFEDPQTLPPLGGILTIEYLWKRVLYLLISGHIDILWSIKTSLNSWYRKY